MVSVNYIVGVAVSLLVFAILFPIAMTEIVGANTTDWNTAVATVFGTLLGVLAIIGVALKYVPKGKG